MNQRISNLFDGGRALGVGGGGPVVDETKFSVYGVVPDNDPSLSIHLLGGHPKTVLTI